MQKDSIGIIYSMLSIAIISTNQGDYFGGQEISLAGLSYLNDRNKDHLWYIHSNYNNLGIANYRLKNYSAAIRFYNLALKYAANNDDKFLYLNNKAKVYEELRNYSEAIKLYTLIIRSIPKETTNYARALANLASAKWLKNPAYNAEIELLVALNINLVLREKFGQNFCYARLADFYSQKNSSIAISYAKKMYVVAKELNSPDDQLEALYKLVKLSSTKDSKEYFVQYEKLNDSIQLARARAKNQFALIRYDTLKLQKDNNEKKFQIAKRDAIIVISLVILIASVIIFIFWYRKRKQITAQETQNAIRENQLKTSKKVHDVVANGLYRVMTEIENRPEMDKEDLLDKIEYMYERSRDISYEAPKANPLSFSDRITALMQSFASANVSIELKGNTFSLWQNVKEHTKNEIEHILQELMVNMDKHSQANRVSLLFREEAKAIHVFYKDNGIGFAKTTRFKNGLNSTGNRIKNISGTITFEQQNEKGLEIHISFPNS
ncbi:ATP-binding protein [Pedobacter sandarakinus]|nr:ATP-binding protein [Pedobacter sandarakinus]